MLGFEQSLVDWESSQSCGFSLGDHHCELELGNENSWLLHNDWIRDQKFMVETFFKAESSHVDIVEAV